ncbi:hypothetical protein V8F06_005151 [Rhypophila decipiens]
MSALFRRAWWKKQNQPFGQWPMISNKQLQSSGVLFLGATVLTLPNEDGALLAGQIVTTANISRKFEKHPESRCFDMNWVKPILLNEDPGPREGVSGLVRGAMACWAADGLFSQDQYGVLQLGHAPETSPPIPQAVSGSGVLEGLELDWFDEKLYNQSVINNLTFPMFDSPSNLNPSAADAARAQNLSAKYPVYAGKRLKGQYGSYQSIIYLFISLGLFAYILVAFRMYLGPAELTSWMGQHVYFAGLGGKVPKEAKDHLADGYRAAMQSELGRVRIKADEPLNRPYDKDAYTADFRVYSGRDGHGHVPYRAYTNQVRTHRSTYKRIT